MSLEFMVQYRYYCRIGVNMNAVSLPLNVKKSVSLATGKQGVPLTCRSRSLSDDLSRDV
jgi:hypothetical protein